MWAYTTVYSVSFVFCFFFFVCVRSPLVNICLFYIYFIQLHPASLPQMTHHSLERRFHNSLHSPVAFGISWVFLHICSLLFSLINSPSINFIGDLLLYVRVSCTITKMSIRITMHEAIARRSCTRVKIHLSHHYSLHEWSLKLTWGHKPTKWYPFMTIFYLEPQKS